MHTYTHSHTHTYTHSHIHTYSHTHMLCELCFLVVFTHIVLDVRSAAVGEEDSAGLVVPSLEVNLFFKLKNIEMKTI